MDQKNLTHKKNDTWGHLSIGEVYEEDDNSDPRAVTFSK
jgi:hypothetical protein